MTTFVDRVVLHVRGGDGGHGCASVHREKFKPLGGPDGGNGGNGGDVVLVVDPQTTTLLDYHRAPHRRAPSGKAGQGGNRNGAAGQDLVLPVPDGTVVRSADGAVLVDLVGAGTRWVVAAGGRGGLGNAALASPRRKAPGFALLGEPGQAGDVMLELKTVADVGLVGFPSAGKSSLVAALSAARPKIADYPFTTLVPNLGVVQAGDSPVHRRRRAGPDPRRQRRAAGSGWSSCATSSAAPALVHVLDCATLEPGRDPLSDLDVIEAELGGVRGRRGHGAADRATAARRAAQGRRAGGPRAGRARPARPGGPRAGGAPGLVGQPRGAARAGVRDGRGWSRRRGRRPRRPDPTGSCCARRPWTTPASRWSGSAPRTASGSGCAASGPSAGCGRPTSRNDEAVGYLADRLARLGVEEALVEAGAVAGAEVVIGDEGRRGLRLGADAGRPERRGRPARHRHPAGERRPAQPAARGASSTRSAGEAKRDARAELATERAAGHVGRRRGQRRRRRRGRRQRRCGAEDQEQAMTQARAGRPAGGPGRRQGRGEGRLVVADHGRRRPRRRSGSTRSSTCSPLAGWPGRRSCWSPPARSRPGWRRWACAAGRATWPPSRPLPASGRAC